MGCDLGKKKYECIGKQSAECVFYERKLPEYSKLKDDSCVVTAETTEELYELFGELKKNFDLSNVKKGCLEFDSDKETVVDLLNKMIEKLCNHETSKGGEKSTLSISDIKITNDLDLSCLEDRCGNKIKSLSDLLQALVDKVCKIYEGGGLLK